MKQSPKTSQAYIDCFIFIVLKPNDIVVSVFQPFGFLEPFKKSTYSTCGDFFLEKPSSECLGIEPQGFFKNSNFNE